MAGNEYVKQQADQLRIMGQKYTNCMATNATLNKQVGRGVGLVNAMTLEIDGLRQENERFREALEGIRAIKQPDGAYISRLDVANTIAKRALEGKQ